MNRGRTREFIQPTGVNELSSIFLAMARTVLIICLLLTEPLASGPLLVILFFISMARHLLIYFSEPMPDNIYNFFLDLVTPCLYGFLLYHLLSVYQADLLSLSVSFFLPGIMYCYLFAREPGEGMGVKTFWGGLFGYIVAFLLVLNYSFDHSNPVVEKYFIAKKYSATTGSDHNGDKGENFYFDLIHVDSISTSSHWEEVDRKDCDYYHNSWMHKRIKLGNETFMVLDKKTYSGPHHQCSFLLQKINGPIEARFMTEREYGRFEKGDTFNIEKHKGILEVQWLTFR